MSDLETVKDVVARESICVDDFFSAMTLACNKTGEETEIFDAKIVGGAQQMCLVGYAIINTNGQSHLQRFSVGEGTTVVRYIK